MGLRNRRRHSAAEKLEIVPAALRNEASMFNMLAPSIQQASAVWWA